MIVSYSMMIEAHMIRIGWILNMFGVYIIFEMLKSRIGKSKSKKNAKVFGWNKWKLQFSFIEMGRALEREIWGRR